MTDLIVEIVDRVIVHAQSMLEEGAYDWPTSRAALERILLISKRGRSATRASGGCAGSSHMPMTHWKSAAARQSEARDAELSSSLRFMQGERRAA